MFQLPYKNESTGQESPNAVWVIAELRLSDAEKRGSIRINIYNSIEEFNAQLQPCGNIVVPFEKEPKINRVPQLDKDGEVKMQEVIEDREVDGEMVPTVVRTEPVFDEVILKPAYEEIFSRDKLAQDDAFIIAEAYIATLEEFVDAVQL